jgi:aldehyde:ferredoxin oxidoreductase
MGCTRKDDRLPERLLKEAMPEGPAKGETWPMDLLLDGFYEVCGWDKRSGVPTRQKLDSLGLEDIAEELSRLGRLP